MSDVEKIFCGVYGIKDNSLIEKISNIARIKKLKKGDLLTKCGDLERDVNFLISGIVRCYTDQFDDDRTIAFGFYYGEALRCTPKLRGSIAGWNEEMVVGGAILSVPAEEMETLIEQYSSLREVYNKIIADTVMQKIEEKMMLQQDSLERYKWFLDKYPGLIDKVEHYKIASYLNMSPVTFARKRSEYYKS